MAVAAMVRRLSARAIVPRLASVAVSADVFRSRARRTSCSSLGQVMVILGPVGSVTGYCWSTCGHLGRPTS